MHGMMPPLAPRACAAAASLCCAALPQVPSCLPLVLFHPMFARLSGALAQGLMSAGNASRIYQLEEEFILANGGEPAPCLPAVTGALTDMGLQP